MYRIIFDDAAKAQYRPYSTQERRDDMGQGFRPGSLGAFSQHSSINQFKTVLDFSELMCMLLALFAQQAIVYLLRLWTVLPFFLRMLWRLKGHWYTRAPDQKQQRFSVFLL